jgi:hypothetical protein
VRDDFARRLSLVPEADRLDFLDREVLRLEQAINQDGMRPPDIQTWMDQVAAALEESEQLERAVRIRKQLLDFAMEHVGADNQATLGHMENLATDLYILACYGQSADLLQHVWEVRRRDLGERTALTLETQRELATALVRAGRYQVALELDRDQVAFYGEKFGTDDERTLDAQNQLDFALQWKARGESGD